MPFNLTFKAVSKDEAMHKLASADGIPASVRAFVAAAIDGCQEVGGNHPIVYDANAKVQSGGSAVAPVAIVVEVGGELSTEGKPSTLSVNVSQG